jgi:hypothetical protein
MQGIATSQLVRTTPSETRYYPSTEMAARVRDMHAGNLTFLPCHYHKQGQGRRHACMHASCRPYVSVVSARQEFIYFPASAIDHVGSVGYQGELIFLERDVVFPISCGCRQLWEYLSWDLH